MKVFAFAADGTEEVELLMVVDLLRRAGMEVSLLSVMETQEIRGAHGIRILCDGQLQGLESPEAELIFLPGGGEGTRNLKNSEALRELLLRHAGEGKSIAAICAAPSVPGALGLLRGRRASCYPGFEAELLGAEYCPEGVVKDGPFFTARGLGYALPLGLRLVEEFQGRKEAEALASKIQYDGSF